MKLKVVTITETLPPRTRQYQSGEKAGQDYTAYTFRGTIEVDGTKHENAEFTAFDEPVAKKVTPGAVFDANGKEFNGKMTYSIRLPKAPSGTGGGGGGGKSWGNREPTVKYSKDELRSLFQWAVLTSAEVYNVDIGNCDPAVLPVVQSGAATLVIAARDCGIKI